MKAFAAFDQRPIVIAVAGPNGAGKTAFYHAHLEQTGLRFINADVLARALKLAPYTAAKVADTSLTIRQNIVEARHFDV